MCKNSQEVVADGEVEEVLLWCSNASSIYPCKYRVCKPCHAKWEETHHRKLDCPCGGDYGAYAGPRSSATLRALIYTWLIVFLRIRMRRVPHSHLYLSVVLGLYGADLAIVPSLTAHVLGFPLLMLLLEYLIVFFLSFDVVKLRLRTLLNRYRAYDGTRPSNIELFVDLPDALNGANLNWDYFQPMMNEAMKTYTDVRNLDNGPINDDFGLEPIDDDSDDEVAEEQVPFPRRLGALHRIILRRNPIDNVDSNDNDGNSEDVSDNDDDDSSDDNGELEAENVVLNSDPIVLTAPIEEVGVITTQ